MDPNIEKVLSPLIELQVKFDVLYENEDDVIITEEQYKTITAEIEQIRNELIK